MASALCLVLAGVLVPIAIVTAWARVQLVEEEAFVATVAPLIDEPAVQDLIIDEAQEAIDAQVDIDGLTGSLFDGIVDLGLGPRAEAALRLLEQPAADGVHGLIDDTVDTVVRSDAFADVWGSIVRGAHRALVTASTSDGGGVVVLNEDGLGVQLGPIVAAVQDRLVDEGIGVASLIPAVDRVVIIGTGESLTLIRVGYALADAVGWWLPVLTLALLAAGVAFARRRGTAVIGAGIALALGGGILGIAFGVGSTIVDVAAGQLDLSPAALGVIYLALVSVMTQTAWVLALVGVFLIVLGWLMTGTLGAERTRGSMHRLNASARASLAARGLDTGAFGRWTGRHRVAVRSVIAVLAVLWLFALRPLGLWEVVGVSAVALVTAWVLELLQIRDTAGASTPVTDAAHADGATERVADGA